MNIKVWNIEAITGYKPFTTFYEDFSIADMFGVNAIKDTYKRAFSEWKTDYKYLTELVMAINWKSWEHAENLEYCKLYSDLYYEIDYWAKTHLKGEELTYYRNTTD